MQPEKHDERAYPLAGRQPELTRLPLWSADLTQRCKMMQTQSQLAPNHDQAHSALYRTRKKTPTVHAGGSVVAEEHP